MRFSRPLEMLLFSAGLALIDLAAVLIAFGVWMLLGYPGNQLIIQGGMAVALVVLMAALAAAWLPCRSLPESWRDLAGLYLFAMPLLTLAFIPLHFLGRGYPTDFANLLAAWAFQAVANLPALAAAGIISHRRLWSQARSG